MSKLRATMAISLDGFGAGPDQSVDTALGVGGERLHEWMIPLAVFREMHGEGGGEGEVNASTAVVRGWWENMGAVVMGRNMFGGGPGPWRGDWRGWWDENPPYHVPVFVLTHHPREPVQMQGGTTFHFATEGIEATLKLATEAAGGKDRVRLATTLTADHSMWIAARAYGSHQENQFTTVAHSAPIYIVVDDEPTWKREAVPELVALQRQQLNDLLTVPINADGDLECFETRDTITEQWQKQRPTLAPRIKEADARYEALLEQLKRRRF